MTKKDDEIILKVGELTQREEFGRGIVRLDSVSMQQIGIKEGDIVEIYGSKKSAAIAIRAYPSDAGLKVIRMDGLVRRNVGSGVGDNVKITRAEVKEAKHVTLAPAQKGIVIQISPSLIKQNIYYRPVSKGDIIVPSPVVKRKQKDDFFSNNINDMFKDFMGFGMEDFFYMPTGEMRFIVIKSEPEGIVRITDLTKIEILKTLPKDFDLEKRAVPAVTYEDVGGIHQAIQKVREMIELPLRHPELFERLGIEPPKGVLLYGPPGTGKTLLARAVANESGANFYSIAGPEVMCVSGETPILLNDKGVTEIKNIFNVPGEKFKIKGYEAIKPKDSIKVYSLDKNMRLVPDEVEYVMKVPVKKAFKFTLNDSSEFTVSENQPFATLNKEGEIEWKTSKELKEGEFIAAAKKMAPKTSIKEVKWYEKMNLEYTYIKDNQELKKLKDYKGNFKDIRVGFARSKNNVSRIKTIKLPNNTSSDFLEFLGLMFSEGSINNGEVSISNLDPKVRRLTKSLFVKIFDITSDRIKEDRDKIKVYSFALSEFLRSVCGLPEGKKSKDINLPSWVFKCSNEEIAAFLRLYFEGDGTTSFGQNGYPTFRFYSNSKTLLTDVQFLLLRFGIVTKITLWKTPLGDLFALVIKGPKGRELFFREIKPIKNKDRMEKYYDKREEDYSLFLPISPMLKRIKELEKLKYGKDIPENSVEPYLSGRKIPTIRQAKKILDLLKKYVDKEESRKLIKKIENLIDSDIYWEKIKRVEEIEKEITLFDLTVKNNSNFLGGNSPVILHNSMWYGKSEENLRKIFQEAEKNAPAIIFIDEIDSIAPKREETKGEVERRVVSTLLTQMDGLKKRGKVIVIAATNRENAIDPALRRPGRFDREIEIGVPDKNGRKEILQIHTRHMPLTKVNLDKLAEITYGYVGADLEALGKEAAMYALRRLLPNINWKEEGQLPENLLEKLSVTQDDFEHALKLVEPSAMREVMIEVPNVKWNDIGGLEKVKQNLQEAVEWPLKNPEDFERLGITPPRGILLYGPPGCGKTMLAKAVATESNANFISVKGPQLFSKWVGESEKRVRELFRKAKQVSPSIIFFDEIDALVPKRGSSQGENVSEKVVSQMLTEMSGLEDLHDVVVIAATNRPDMLDPALLRPGRFDRKILVSGPDEKARLKILELKTKNVPLKGVNLKELAKETEEFSGADIDVLVREAAMNALRRDKKSKEVTSKDFEESIKEIKASLSKDVIKFYEQFDERSRKELTENQDELKYVG